MDAELLKALVGLGGVPFIVGLTEVFKPFFLDKRVYPVLSIFWGLAINLGIAWGLGWSSRMEVVAAILTGVLAGLAACGLYSTGATFRLGDQAVKTKGSPNASGEEAK